MTKLIFMTDLHYLAEGAINDHDPRARVAAAVAEVQAQFADADACVITGDLVERGTARNYAGAASALATLPMPVHCLVGNHDERVAMAWQFAAPKGAMEGFRQYVVDLGAVRLICLDTAQDGLDEGALCAARLDWLRAALDAARGRKVIVAMHHPPVPLGLPMQDKDHVASGGVLIELCAAHGDAQIICGHVHRAITTHAQAVPVTALRAVCYQAPPPWPAWDWSGFEPAQEPPGFGVLLVEQGRAILHQHQFCPYEHGVARPASQSTVAETGVIA